MFLIEASAAIFVLRWATHWLAGVVLGLILVAALALQGIWWPLAFLVGVVALVVWIVRHVTQEDAPARQVREPIAGYSFDAPSLRAVYGDRLDRTRRWSTR